MVKALQRFEVYWVVLDPTRGREIQKTRPCVIVSPTEMNLRLDTVIVAPMTSTLRNYSFRPNLIFNDRISQVALDQIRSVSKERLLKNIGKISPQSSRKILALLREMFEE